ncbi:hypothetical protein EDD52_13619 [Primorskyibacter sedentarius]|uniref:Uncharacterized protein n=1 Tax=Primorskyibacter sedentarius TaxID=745311 RepID=A0A4R3IRT7_9RHOB|nr:hypothetical protein EDD52_13619 [Primorskyibacter sedentarius]
MTGVTGGPRPWNQMAHVAVPVERASNPSVHCGRALAHKAIWAKAQFDLNLGVCSLDRSRAKSWTYCAKCFRHCDAKIIGIAQLDTRC